MTIVMAKVRENTGFIIDKSAFLWYAKQSYYDYEECFEDPLDPSRNMVLRDHWGLKTTVLFTNHEG